MEILLIRHGETELNVRDVTHKRGDEIGLTSIGRAQALRTADVCKSHQVKVIYSSPELRATETATIIGDQLGLTPIISPKLAERNLGDWLGRPWSEIQAILEKMDTHARYTFTPPNGESWQQKEERLKDVLSEIIALQQNTAVVTHGGALRGLMPILTGQPVESSFDYNFRNASVTIFEEDKSRFKQIVVNDISHLE